MHYDMEHYEKHLKLDAIRELSREELEMRFSQAAIHLLEGMRLIHKANDTIQWLAQSVIMLSTQLAEFEPSLKDVTEMMADKARQCLDSQD